MSTTDMPSRSTYCSQPINGATPTTIANPVDKVFQDNFLNDVFWALSSQGPAFAIDEANVHFVEGPVDFFDQLISGIRRAKHRINMASLYLGTGKHEQQLVDEMIAACKRNSTLKVHILVDGLRGTRLGPSTEKPGIRVSSATMLQPLLNQFQSRVSISMYHTPDLNGVLKRILPPRVNEVIGVQHLKAYVFDDDLIIGGANLSKDYFTDRQDRMVCIYRTASLSTFFDNVVNTIGELSLKQDTNGNSVNQGTIDPVTESSQFKLMAEKRLASLLEPNSFYTADNFKHSLSSPLDVQSSTSKATWIFPTIQMGPFNIRHDEVCSSYIFANIPSTSKFFVASPYFNLTKNYLQLILSGKPQIDIITCSPETNGFAGATGMSGVVPDLYGIIERRFLQKTIDTGNSGRISIVEYIRHKWSYHAKGMWITAPDQKLPNITLIGSPNFGSRSVEKDLEAELIFITENEALRQKMNSERMNLWRETQTVDMPMLNARKVTLWVRFIVYLFGNYL
ncbi:hypothetical protein SAMD00019534_119780 [Acytostelium subglobosum LB1]|uniref:hypothetical protein n=1 Tax=Acytostelium subglobosum LB1 TaxID=1410327 RepID=UPI000644FFEE|nr:hypothetical protein SAMD00019534_119780 [Acytostelium subglobosum LB1]GAM28802.1 hypothetical protein SAMD00019534_119780 [Acytostelium subglobosum LB1]|eukprot:XP_012748174.1 hypothetical protein SAMD00019534_119780 [Acytostelium subglobosum LB1]